MKDIREVLKDAIALQELATKRGLDKARIGYNGTWYDFADDLAFEEAGVTIGFIENTRHDCPDKTSVLVTVKELEMSDDEWASRIESIKLGHQQQQEAKTKKEKENQLEYKKKQYEKLKQELGF